MEDRAKAPRELQKELGERLRAFRIYRALSQAELAGLAGISLGALQHLENEGASTLETFVRVLKALGAADTLKSFVPVPTVSPLALLKNPKPPQRVRRPRHL